MESETVEADTDGSICSIHVRNFFCHDNLQIDLNKNVNFVVGRNGSGKSAILTALVVGLGGRASATNRGNNLHSFIKKGANSASVEIKIRNSSEQAYKHEIYGDFITIERHMNASGGSSYKVKNSSGRVVSTKFDEVNNIITAHDIQVDNPISVLNQDDARSFHASDAKKKFMLFRKATNLDRTEINYNSALDSCKQAEHIWTRKSEALEEVKKELKKLKTAHDRLQSRSEIVAQEKALVNEYYWSEIAQYEREAELIKVQQNKQKAKIDKLVDKLKEMQNSYGSNNGTIDALRAQLNEHTLQRTVLEQELRDLETQVRQAQTAMRGFVNTANKHGELIKRERRKIGDLEREINSINSGDAASQRESLSRAATAAKAAADAARARYDTAQHDYAQSGQHASHIAAKLERASQPRQRASDKLVRLRQEVRELESRGDDSLGVYGAHMAALCRAVDQANAKGQFTAKPRGPVGAHLKVREKKWGGALEHVLGGSVQAFLVNADQDRTLLFQIMNKIYGRDSKPSVTCSKFFNKQHDVSRQVVRAGPHLSALDSLVVDDPVVANYLIDNIGVERVLMVPDHADAQRLSDRVENVPANCSRIVTLDSTEYHPAPRYRSYGGANPRARFLAVSNVERKRQLLADIKEAEAQLKRLEAEEREAAQEHKDAKEAERMASRNLQALLGDRHNKEEAERAALAALDTQQAPHHAVLVEELNISKEKLATLTAQVEEWAQKERAQKQNIDEIERQMKAVKTQFAQEQRTCRNLDVEELNISKEKLTAQVEEWAQKERAQKQNIDEIERQMKAVKTQFAQEQRTCRNLDEEIEKEQLKQDQGVTDRQTVQQRLKEEKAKLAQVEATLQERLTVIHAKVGEAETLCPRLDNPRDKETVKREIEKAKSKLNSIRTDGRSKAEVAEELLRVETKDRETQHKLDRIKELVELCTKSTKRHRHESCKLQQYIARRVQHDFNAMLTVNGYSGNMKIDFSNAVLEITCTGREATRHASTTASLSGGERSYSTVAFIMALWACVELPFYFLDEFDVFMDNVNRAKVMNMLLKHALDNPTRQFVFLTPQDASSVKAGPRISIHVMADPRP